MPESRSHTDTLTNLVVLSSLDIGRHFREIIDRDFPIVTLPTFLHEATHHWCFDTPVGIAMHLLFLRARRAAYAAVTGTPSRDDGWDIFDSVVRYEIMREVIRPLSEGLALFAEHDAIPGRARTLSQPMVLASGLYGRGYAISTEDWGGLPLVLAAGRVSRTHARRKASLLVDSMSCRDGGYLPGYLLVKNLWRFALERCPLFADADFFLQYLRSRFFDDWGLVACLLDDTRKDISALDPIAAHLSQRIARFIEIDVEGDRPQRFEAATEKNETSVLQVRTDVIEINIAFQPDDTSSESALGRARLEEGIRSHFASWFGQDDLDGLLSHDRAELVQRRVLNLGHSSGHGRPVSKGFELLLGEDSVATVKASTFPDGLPEEGPVDFDFLSSDQVGSLCFVLTREGHVLCAEPIGTVDLPSAIQQTLANRRRRTTHAALSRELIDDALIKTGLEGYVEDIRDTFRPAIDDWFVSNALLEVPEESRAELRRDAKDDGLLALLDRDLRLVMDAAVASLVIPSGFTFGSVESFHTWSTDSPAASVQKVNSLLLNRLGFQPFPGDDESFLRVSFI
jgi:hypothetical protein